MINLLFLLKEIIIKPYENGFQVFRQVKAIIAIDKEYF